MMNRTSIARPARLAAATLAFAAALLAPAVAGAAVARLDAGTQVGTTQTTGTSVSGTKTVSAGSNRVLLVTIYVQKSASDTTFGVTTATFGGQALTQAVITPATTTSRDKVYIGYLNEAGIVAASGNTINVTIGAGTTTGWAVFAQTYQGVNQTTPITATAQNFSETNTNTSASFGAAIGVNAGGYAYYALAFNSASGTRTLPAGYAQSWSLAAATSPSAFGDDKAEPTAGTENPTITYSAGQRYVLGAVTLNPAPSGTITLGNNTGTDAANATVCAVGGGATYVDYFTLLASAAGTNVTGVTTTFSPTIPAGLLGLLEVTDDAGVAQGSLANPTGTNPAVSGMSFAAPTATTQYRLRLTPAATATTSGTFTATVTGVTNSGGFTVSGADGSSATIVVDGQASPDVNGAGTTVAAGTVTASWVNPPAGTVPATDFGSYVVVLGNSVAITGTPAKGTASYTVGATVGADSVVCSGNIATCAKTGLGPNQTYFLKIFTRDGCANWSAGVQVSGTTPNIATTIADGTNPPNVTQLAPGGAETPLDAFTLVASPGSSDTVTALTVSLAAGTSAGLSQVRIMGASNCTGTQYFGAVAPASDTVSFSGGTAIPVTTTATPYTVCVTPRSAAAMPPPPGSVYAVTGKVTAFTSTNAQAGADAGSATVNVDNASSPDVTAASAVGGSGTVTASWSNPGPGVAPASDFGGYVVVLGNTVAVSNVPAEGTASYTAGSTVGTDTVVCAGNVVSCAQTGLAAGTTYFMKIFTRDLVSNWSPGVAVSATTTDVRTTPVALTGAVASCSLVNLAASFTGDSNANNTVAFARGTDGVTFGTTICAATGGGTNPRTCADATVAANTSYYYRATWADADGVVGATTRDSGLVAVGACAASVAVTAGTMPPGTTVAAGSSGTTVGRILLTPSGTVTLASLSISNAGTAVAGTDVASLAIFDVTGASSVFVGAGAWNATTSRWDFTSLAYGVTAPTTLAVVLNVAPGATAGRSFAMSASVPADVTVASPATVSNTATIAGSTFNITGGTPGGSPASNAPMVSILNPATGGVVSGTFKVQVRVFNKVGNLGINGLAATNPVQVSTNNGQTWAVSGATFVQPVTANNRYDAVYGNDPSWVTTVTGRTYEAQLSLPPGSYTVRAQVQNAVPVTVTSEAVQITVAAAGKGDGKLLVRDNSSQLCSDCHAVQTHSSEALGTKYGAWAANCRDCHAPHRTRNIHLVNESIIPPSVVGTVLPAANVGYSLTTGATAANGWDATNRKPTGAGTFANQDNTGPCQVCHTRTKNPNTSAARWQRTANADTHYTVGAGTASCGGCHSHAKGFAAGESGGGAACASCHGTIWDLMNGTTGGIASRHLLGSVGGTNDSPADSGQLWNPQALLTNVPPAQRSCVNMCHGDHPHDLTNPADSTHSYNLYLDPSNATSRADGTATRTQANRANEDFDPATNTGLCVRCHTQPIVAGGITVSAAAFGASAHDFVSYAGTAWQYTLHSGTTSRNCTKCHASRAEGTTPNASANGSNTAAVHGTQDDSLLAGSKRGGTAPYVCFNCHGSAAPVNGAQGNRSSKPIQAQLAKAHAHPVGSDTVHDSVAERSGAAFGNALGGKARHVNCMDCHDTHQTKAGLHVAGTNLAGPSLEGAWGAQFATSIAFWTAPAAGNFTQKTIVAGVDVEATLCFKCHSSFYGTLPTTPSGAFTETDTAKEFNPGNVGSWGGAWAAGKTAGGFHPVLASAAGNLGATNNILAPFTKTSLMTCSDCHASDTATDPGGPHGSAAAFMLKGPNTTWNNTLTLNTSTGMPAGTFCATCHAANFANTRGNPPHLNGNHSNVPCMNCHAAIPHGGPRPGMLVAGAGAGANVGGTIATWDNVSPYWQGTASNRLYLNSYPANGTTNWSQGNCGCNGTGHCLPAYARIATPGGEVPVYELHPGDLVYSEDALGRRVVAPIARLEWLPVRATHRLVQLTLEDGRVVQASAGHPLPDGTLFSDVRAGAIVDGGVVVRVDEAGYALGRTYDLLPEGATGLYWADGVLLGSTLAPTFQVACR